ncbi:MAG: helix-turn-helix domain-containing protein [Burkholderiaceae bacterium]
MIDNDVGGLRPLIESLRSAGHRVSLVFDGEQGYNRAVSSLPDLIVTDVGLPRLDGYALCRWLKATAGTADIPVIFLSAADKMQDKLAGLRCGAVDYVTKPYIAEELVARVQIHLRLSRMTPVRSIRLPEQVVDAPIYSPPTVPANATGVSELVPAHFGDLGLAQNSASDREGADGVLARAAQHELLANLSLTPSLAGIAQRLGVNGRRLSRAFHRHMGMTLFEYLREERMRVACRLLRETSLSVAAIATELGYSSAANFSTAFRAHAGQSPSAYRASPSTFDGH